MISGSKAAFLSARIAERLEVHPDNEGGYVVSTPFAFDDGDELLVVVREDDDGWYVTDEGHTLSKLSVGEVNVLSGNREVLLESFLRRHRVVRRPDGELRVRVDGDEVADALFGFLQAVSKASSLTKVTREFVRSTFIGDLASAVDAAFPGDIVTEGWTDPDHDPDGAYPVDYRVLAEGPPLFIFATNNDDRTRQAIIAWHHHHAVGPAFESVAVLEDESELSPRVRSQLHDTFGRPLESHGDVGVLTNRLRGLITTSSQ